MEYKVSWAVRTGRHHRLEDIPCQDWVTVRREDGLVCCVLADGAGSRSRSELGAECVTQAAAELLAREFEALWVLEQLPLAETVIGRCVQALNSLEPPHL
ncbi:protein phosphatase 2C domain-containing protein [Pseudoflavonifractor phocaeensis]|uniref:protein phosphatase 2C domain-containing protein n=1 Tax=Pseudoflavonifractor phocaeensis TaxID=1870988 RepID=UPI00195ECB92|nr:protein phosphatase 2C domain-containing protein [Pseudoflavonifractor phocaeensis]MBM6886687.1 protein phosphatase 2C domain-containing protein [Pseudoflavonifractor phocaeensis]